MSILQQEFKKLENRVSLIEAYLKIKNKTPSGTATFIIKIEYDLRNENITSLSPTPIYTALADHDIFVRIYVHGLRNVKSAIKTESGGSDYYQYLYINPYYSVLVIKKFPSFHEYIFPRMNTVGTLNIHIHGDFEKTLSLYFGYSNQDKNLPESNLFVEGVGKGIFFIINDKEYRRVLKYVNEHSSDFSVIESGLADKNIDIYKSAHLKVNVDVIILGKPTTTVAFPTLPKARESEQLKK
jgi:hypothetical protein